MLADFSEKFRLIRFCLILAFTLLVIPNLGTRPLWQDEAETALVARQMVKTNTWLPYAYDDQGPISQDWNYQFKVSPLWRWHPWLQFYVTALSFKLIGVSAFSARLPFALLGIAAYWYFLNFLTRRNPSFVFFLTAAVLFLLSVPLLLHFRQARYYALSLFFTILTIDGYLNIYQTHSKGRILKGYSLKYLMGSIFLFHSFLPGALALQISFWIHQFLSFRAKSRNLVPTLRRDDLNKFAIAFSATLLLTLPWAVWLKIGGQNLNFSPDLIKQHAVQHYLYIHKFIFPAFTLIPLISMRFTLKLLSKLATTPTPLVLFSIFISISLLLYTFNHPYFFRYLIPLIPLFIYIAAWIIANSKPIWSLIPLISLILMTAKTFPKYLFEITHPHQTANAEIIGFLSSLDPDKYQKLAVNYDDFTFRFHTTFIVYGAQQLENLLGEISNVKWVEDGIFETIKEEPSKTLLLDQPGGDDAVSEDSKPSVSKKYRRDTLASVCPDVIIIFPDWGNETLLREIATQCQLTPSPLSLHYAKLADDPNPINHRFTQPPLGTLEAFLAPPSPS